MSNFLKVLYVSCGEGYISEGKLYLHGYTLFYVNYILIKLWSFVYCRQHNAFNKLKMCDWLWGKRKNTRQPQDFREENISTI